MEGEEEVGSSGGEQVAEATPTPAPAVEATPAAPSIGMDTELPADLASKFGVKTLGEAYSRYSSSSSEGRRLAEERSKLERELEIERAVKRNIPQPAPQKKPMYGLFKDQNAYFEALQNDFDGTQEKYFKAMLSENKGVLAELLKEELDKREEPYKKESAERQRHQWLGEMSQRNPELAPGGELRHVIEKFNAEGGADVVEEFARRLQGMPGINPYEVFAHHLTYGIVRGKVDAAKAGQSRTQSRAVVANNGTGTQGKKVPENKQQEIEALLDEEEQQGAKIPKEVREATIAAFAPKAKNVRLSKRT